MTSRPHLRRREWLLATVVLAATVAVVLAVTGGEASADHVSCGDTITVDTTLDSDLVDCPNNGIVIGADDITLDLNGHTISGDGQQVGSCPENEACEVGVLNDGHDGVTMRDGSVREFDTGVVVFGARDNRVIRISSKKNISFGFFVFDSSHSRVRDSSGSDNIPPEGDGMGVFFSHGLRIVDNTFRNNAGPGIHVDGSNGNLIKGNLFSHSSPGVLIGGDEASDRGDRNEVRGNRFVRNDGGVGVNGSRNVVKRNRLFRDGHGIAIEQGSHNLVARNVVIDARSRGISLGLDLPDESIGGVDNIVRRNVVRGSAGDAFLVNHKGSSLLKRNLASGAKGDGFHIESRSTKLTKNRAPRNAAIGIEAVRGVIDGGGNRANGNGGPHQCVNVNCH